MRPTDEQIIEQAKQEGQQVGWQAFSELARRPHTGVDSPYGMGFIDGAVWCRDEMSNGITVKDIADMQRYIDGLEDFLWRMAMFIEGKDDPQALLVFTEEGSAARFATSKIYDFIKYSKQLISKLGSENFALSYINEMNEKNHADRMFPDVNVDYVHCYMKLKKTGKIVVLESIDGDNYKDVESGTIYHRDDLEYAGADEVLRHDLEHDKKKDS